MPVVMKANAMNRSTIAGMLPVLMAVPVFQKKLDFLVNVLVSIMAQIVR